MNVGPLGNVTCIPLWQLPLPYPQPCPEFHRLGQLVGLWVVMSIQTEHVHGVVTPDLPRHASMCMVWSHPIYLGMLDGVYMVWSHPIYLVTPLSCWNAGWSVHGVVYPIYLVTPLSCWTYSPIGMPHLISLPSPFLSPPGIL